MFSIFTPYGGTAPLNIGGRPGPYVVASEARSSRVLLFGARSANAKFEEEPNSPSPADQARSNSWSLLGISS